MCGRFTQQRPSLELGDLFDAQPSANLPARFNVAPTQDALVVVERVGDRRIVAYRWGFVAHWADDLTSGGRQFNARSETVASSPTFGDSFRRRRCIVPVDGFYEWRRDGRVRRPFLVRRRDGQPLALAGIWSGWHDADRDAVVRTFSILTTQPNDVVATLHDRMPVILAPETWSLWLDVDHADPGELPGLLGPSPAADLELVAVSRLVNDVRNEGPDLVAPAEAEQLTVLG